MGPTLQYYRCVRCYFSKTRCERVCNTVSYIPHKIKPPAINLDDYLTQVAEDIIHILTNPPSPTTPSLTAEDPVCNVLLTLAEQLKRAGPIDNTNTSSPRVRDEFTTDYTSPRVQNPSNTSPPASLPDPFPHTTPTPADHIAQPHNSTIALEHTTNVSKNRRYNNQRPHRTH